jgi:hypothetical protein
VSVEIPKCAITLGPYGIPQSDIIELKVHLGCTKEVSSFEVLLQNWNGKYSPGGTYPLSVGQDGYIDIGRGTNVPQIITTRTESIKYESTPTENYVRVAGRCWGEKLFRRVVTKTYTSQKGEAIVKDLLDYYVGLSHVRNSVELVENTDTTYTKLEYTDSPVWDILKYIAESSDLAGVIGYDFRVAPDGKFEFFAKNSKTSPVSLSEKIEQSEYRTDIHRIRNKIMIYGIADKSVPLDKDAWTESLTPTDGVWTATSGTVSFDTAFKAKGIGSIKLYAQNLYNGGALFTLNSGKEVNCNLYPILEFLAFLEKALSGNVTVLLFDTSSREAHKNLTIGPDEWRTTQLRVGVGNESDWESIQTGFDWTQVKRVRIDCNFAGVGTGSFWIDGLYFGGRRYAAVREDVASQILYTNSEPRELTETDEELWSDNECDLRAKALLAYLKDPAEYLTVSSTIIDYGTTPILAGDKIHITLPNENVDSDFRIESVEYNVDAKTQTLEVTLELGKIPPQLADYLYGMRATTITVEKLSRTKLGKKGIPSVTQSGGIGSHHVAHEAGDNDGNQWPDPAKDGGWDKITGWVCPRFWGPFDDSAAMIQFRTKNKDGSTILDHQFIPTDDKHGLLGSETKNWKEVHSLAFFLPDTGYVRITLPDENALMQLTKDRLEFGPGGAVAPDVYLKRVAAETFELKALLLQPAGDNVTELGSLTKRLKKIYVADFALDSNFLPTIDNAYDIGVGGVTPKRWRNLCFSGFLEAGGYAVITATRVLQNVTAAAAIITSGRFPLARLLDASAGYVLEAEGAGFDPMYVDPNGRYTPAGHDHAAGNITSGVLAEDRCPHVYSSQVTFQAGLITNSVNCTNWHLADAIFANDFRITEAEKLGLGHGLAFLNQKGKLIMLLDEKGNLRISGEVQKLDLGRRINP